MTTEHRWYPLESQNYDQVVRQFFGPFCIVLRDYKGEVTGGISSAFGEIVFPKSKIENVTEKSVDMLETGLLNALAEIKAYRETLEPPSDESDS